MSKLIAVLGLLLVTASLSAQIVDDQLIADDKPNLYDRQQIRANQPYNQSPGNYYYQGSPQGTQGSYFYYPPDRGGYNPNAPARNNSYYGDQGYYYGQF